MKRASLAGLVLTLVLGTSICAAWAEKADDAAIRKEIQAYMSSVADMMDRKDLEGIVRTVIPGATLRYVNGVEATIEEWREKASKELAGIEAMKSEFTVEKVVAKGDTRIATYRESHSYALAGDKGHKYRSLSRWSVTLAKTDRGWKPAHFVELSEKLMRDGKLLKPKATLNPL